MTTAALPVSTALGEDAWLLRRSGDDDSIVRLGTDKVTIGSGQSCSVRLTDEGVRPLHCLITPGPDGLVVRRWSDGTLLNGQAFTEAPLVPGDRLSIGPVDLVLEQPSPEGEEDHLPESQPSEEWSAEPEAGDAHLNDESAFKPTEETVNGVEATTSNAQQLEQSLRTNRGRARQLVQYARRQRAEQNRLEAELANLQIRLIEVETERHELQGERDDLRNQLGVLARDMLEVREELRSRTAAEESKVAELEQRLADLELQISERDELLIGLRRELEQRRDPEVVCPESDYEVVECQELDSEAIQALAESEAAVAQELATTEEELQAGPAQPSQTIPVGATPTEKFGNWGAAEEQSEQATRPEEPAVEAAPADAEVQETATVQVASDEDSTLEQSEEVYPTQSDPWGAVPASAPATAPEDLWTAKSTPEPAVAGKDMWDIERQAPEPLVEPVSTPEATAIPSEAQTAAAADATAEQAAGEEGDVWGRLTSLRAAASEKLHYEVEHPAEPGAEAEPLWDLVSDQPDSDPTNPAETDTAEVELELSEPITPTAEEAAKLEMPIEYQSEDLWGEGASAAAEAVTADESEVASPVDSVSEPLAESLAEPSTDQAVTVSPTTAFDPPPESPKDREEPVSFVERYQHLLEEDEAGSLPAAEAPTPEPPAPEPIVEAPVAGDDNDESIEDYMAKMMARLRGESSPAPAISEAPAASKSGPAPSTEPASVPHIPKSTESLLARPKPLTEMLAGEEDCPAPPEKPLENLDEIKSSSKPEQSTDMSSLRDLANSSAREAIKIANSRRDREVALSNLLMCITGAIGGGYLIWSAGGELGLQLFCGAGAIAGAAFWALRTARSVSGQPEPKAKQVVPDDSSHELPIAGVDKR